MLLGLQRAAGLSEARTLAASDPAFKLVQNWLDKAHFALQSGKMATALSNLVNAADEAVKAIHPEAANLRLAIGGALLDVGRRL